MKQFILNFRKLWSLDCIDELPEYNGIYCVYLIIPSSIGRPESIRLIYIGKADEEGGIRKRFLSGHHKMSQFEKYVSEGNQVFISCSPVKRPENKVVSSRDIHRVESALIYSQQPRLNGKKTDSFNFQDTIVNIKGENALLEEGIWEGDKGNVTINLY